MLASGELEGVESVPSYLKYVVDTLADFFDIVVNVVFFGAEMTGELWC